MIKYDEIKKIIKIIEECSAVALTFYKQKHLEVSFKDDNSPVTKADLEISRIATNKLSEMFPNDKICLLYTSPSPRDISGSRMPSSA